MTLPSASKLAPADRRNARLLIVDAEPRIADLLRLSFAQVGHGVTPCGSGKRALHLLQLDLKEQFELVILDLVLPDIDGLELIRQIRRHSDIPILVLSALSRPNDIVDALDQGADGYICKPVAFAELEAAVQALLRRIYHLNRSPRPALAAPADIRLHPERRLVTIGQRTIRLSATEYRLMRLLLTHANRPVRKTEMLRQVWGCAMTEPTNVVELAIARLRRKIEDDPSQPTRLVTVRSIGYQLCLAAPPAPASPVSVSPFPPVAREHAEAPVSNHAAASGSAAGLPLLPGVPMWHLMA
jgi:DNA-binding response OmpR family regulator